MTKKDYITVANCLNFLIVRITEQTNSSDKVDSKIINSILNQTIDLFARELQDKKSQLAWNKFLETVIKDTSKTEGK